MFHANPILFPYIMCCPCENPQYHTSTHFFDVAKNAPSELHTYEILTRAAPKKLRKKCQKSRSGELGSQPVIYNYILWKRKKATRRDQLWSWRGEMVHVRHTDLSVVYKIRLFQKKRKKARKTTFFYKWGQDAYWVPKFWTPEKTNLISHWWFMFFRTLFLILGAAYPRDASSACGPVCTPTGTQEGSCGVRALTPSN